MNVNILHIGKTGGSAIRDSLKQFDQQMTTHGVLNFIGHHGKLNTDAKYVFFLRNPVKRFVSSFLSGLRQGKPRYDSPWSHAEAYFFNKFKTPNQLAEALFEDNEASLAILHLRHVNRPFSSYLGDIQHINKCQDNILYVGVMETLEHDFNQICNLLNVKSDLIKDEVISHKTPKEYDNIKFLSEKGKQNIKRLYDYDYKIFELLRNIGKIDDKKFKIIS